MSAAEIAERLTVSIKTVRNLASSARKKVLQSESSPSAECPTRERGPVSDRSSRPPKTSPSVHGRTERTVR
jgi:hypothetical protein